MNKLDRLRLIMRELEKIEGDLQVLCGGVDFKTECTISDSILEAQELRDCLLNVEKALKVDAYGGQAGDRKEA